MTPLVLVHGFMGGSAQWNLQRHTFEQERDVIAVDLPGFGKNNTAPALSSIPDMADWVIAEVTTRGVMEFDLMGHSMGGMIAQQMAHQEPERVKRLILYSTGSIGVLPGRFETIVQSKLRGQEDGIAKTARRISATWFLEKERAHEFEACAHIAQQTTQPAFTGGLDAMQGWSGVGNLISLRPKTLVLWGDQDRTYPWAQVEQLWQSIPNTQLAVVPGCAHAVHLEKPQLFNQIVLDFLNRR